MKKGSIIPLFPLSTVLFPGQLLPLHIFEPRYRVMVKECIAKSSAFGVVLIRKGFEVGEPADPYPVGTTARITQVDRKENGMIDLICVGEERFHIRSLRFDRPFLSGIIDLWPWDASSEPLESEPVGQIQAQLARYLRILTHLTGSAVQVGNLPSDANKLAHLAAIALRISNQEKQDLLAAANLGEMMERCIQLLRRENQVLKTLAAIPDPTISAATFYSPN